MRPVADLPPTIARDLRGLLFDLDDTLLSHGTLTRAAYEALWDLRDAGMRLVAVTGRPCGWGEVLVRQWPIDGIVTENGAISMVRTAKSVDVIDRCTEVERASRRARLTQLATRVRSVVPEARLTDDVRARRSDITWDIGETVRLPSARVRLLTEQIVKAGARSSQSSVHLHATFEEDDKASGAVRFLVEVFGEDAGAALAHYAFVGDSGNDATCFAAFRTTFGVANVRGHFAHIPVGPGFVSSGAMGEGFREIAGVLLRLRAFAP